MRTVIVYLAHATEAEITTFLQRTYPFQKGPPWIYPVKGDACLYINIYKHGEIENSPEHWEELVCKLGGQPSVSLSADISGRHEGDKQVKDFVCTILGKFEGLAEDEYTNHFWTLKEVESGNKPKFFDRQKNN